MPKRRKVQVDPELLKQLEDLELRSAATDRRIAEVLARLEEKVARLIRQTANG